MPPALILLANASSMRSLSFAKRLGRRPDPHTYRRPMNAPLRRLAHAIRAVETPKDVPAAETMPADRGSGLAGHRANHTSVETSRVRNFSKASLTVRAISPQAPVSRYMA